MKIFVTGATGYLGYQLALVLAEAGHTVHALVRDTASPRVPQHPNIFVFKGDITDPASLSEPMRGCSQAYHTAAMVSLYARPSTSIYQVNVDGTRNVLAAALEHHVKKLVYTSSCAVLGRSLYTPLCESDPRVSPFSNDYELSKFMAECLVKEYGHKGLFTVIVSPSRIYGPGFERIPYSTNNVIRRFLRNKLTFMPKPRSLQANYCFIEDVVKGHLLAMDNGIGGEKYILGGENISYKDFFGTLSRYSGANPPLVEVPLAAMKCWAAMSFAWEKMRGGNILFTPAGIDQFFFNKAYCHNKAVRQLGYRPTSFEDGIKQTIIYLEKEYHG